MEGTLSARSVEDVVLSDGAATPFALGRPSRSVANPRLPRRIQVPQVIVFILVGAAATAHLVVPASSLLPSLLSGLAALGAALLLFEPFPRKQCDAAPRHETTPDSSPTHPGAQKQGTWNQDAAAPMVRRQTSPSALTQELAQAAAMAQLTQRISHELRTPLNAVIGFSELMSQETFGPLGSRRYLDYAQHIRECGQTLLKSAEDTLALTSTLADPARQPAAVSRPCDLALLVDDAITAVAAPAQQQSVRFDVAVGAHTEVIGDRRCLRQILVNLLAEAVTRSRFHGRIRVTADLERETARIDIAARDPRDVTDDDSLAVSVARALAELHGRRLTITHSGGGNGQWIASLELDLALQPDFFRSAREIA